MINTQTAELFIGIITFLIAYLIMVTVANVFRAWVASKMGDDTGIELGFLTLNPLVHVDPIGMIFLFIVLSERFSNIAQSADYITIIVPIVLILFYSSLMRLLAVNLISYAGYSIAYLLGFTV